MIPVTSNHKSVTTPFGRAIEVPTKALAERIEQESERKEKPLTHLASVAIDLVIPQRTQVLDDILPYVHTDVVCYRADNNLKLYAHEEALLDPIVAWANGRFGFTLTVTQGIMPADQPENVATNLIKIYEKYTDFQLAALAVATKLLGSILLASALVEGFLSAEQAFTCATIEDDFETSNWGKDEEKEVRLTQLKRELMAVEEFINLLQ